MTAREILCLLFFLTGLVWTEDCNQENKNLSGTVNLTSLDGTSDKPFVIVVITGHLHKCPPGFHTHGASCYWFSTIKGNYGFARSICGHLRSHLAIVTSRSEDNFLRSYASQRGKATQYYIGGSDLGLDRWWRWEGGLPFRYTNWGKGEPNNRNEHCVGLLRTHGYKWNDTGCQVIQNFICERR